MKRNPSIELYRMVLMFGVVMVHSAAHSTAHLAWLSCMFFFCVTGFVFVSGYFGMSFKLMKLVRLYAVALVCVLIDGCIEGHDIFASAFVHLRQCWFLHAYVALMLVVPLLNAALERSGWEIPFLFLAFGWSYLFDIGHLRPYIFPVDGFGSHALLTLLGIYVAGRLFRKYDIETRFPIGIVMVIAVALFAFGALRLSRYNSPFAVILVASLFVLFKKIDLSPGTFIGRIVLYLSPSMFAVYVLHNSDYNEYLTAQFGARLIANGLSPVMSCFLAAAITFGICLVVDIIRREFIRGGKCLLRPVHCKIYRKCVHFYGQFSERRG